MPFTPAPNIVQVELRARKAGQKVENRWFVNCLHEPTTSDFAAIALQVFTVLRASWLPFLPSDVAITELFLRSMQSINAIQLTVAALPTDVGSSTGTPGPNQNTLCVSLRSTSSGRSARGRLYWLGLSEDQYTVNTMVASARTQIRDAVEAMRFALSNDNHPWTIVSFFSGGGPRPGGPVYFLVSTVLTVDDVIDSQRRRMPGRGQ